jgi:hypothetical protein
MINKEGTRSCINNTSIIHIHPAATECSRILLGYCILINTHCITSHHFASHHQHTSYRPPTPRRTASPLFILPVSLSQDSTFQRQRRNQARWHLLTAPTTHRQAPTTRKHLRSSTNAAPSAWLWSLWAICSELVVRIRLWQRLGIWRRMLVVIVRSLSFLSTLHSLYPRFPTQPHKPHHFRQPNSGCTRSTES